MKYFPLLYRLHAEERYLIWISDGNDSVVVDAGGFIPSFRDLTLLRRYAELNHYSLESEEPQLHDLDWIAPWRVAQVASVDCEGALTAWNLFADVASSVPEGVTFKPLDSQFPGIYKKLFWGSNLPSVTPQGEHYTPEWSPDEIHALGEILIAGLELFVSCVRAWPSGALA